MGSAGAMPVLGFDGICGSSGAYCRQSTVAAEIGMRNNPLQYHFLL
jgi:hypothetical protein